jgi:putative oxidoreductase
MIPTRDDFKIKNENFKLAGDGNLIRIACGLFLLPHAVGKFESFGQLNPGVVHFFGAVGFSPPEAWVYLAAVSELTLAVALTLGLCTRFAALGVAVLMAIAVYSLQVVKGFGWAWNTGGYEYPVFWGICALYLAIREWKAALSPTTQVEFAATALGK